MVPPPVYKMSKVLLDKTTLQQTADAIRGVNGTTGKLRPSDFPKVGQLPVGSTYGPTSSTTLTFTANAETILGDFSAGIPIYMWGLGHIDITQPWNVQDDGWTITTFTLNGNAFHLRTPAPLISTETIGTRKYFSMEGYEPSMYFANVAVDYSTATYEKLSSDGAVTINGVPGWSGTLYRTEAALPTGMDVSNIYTPQEGYIYAPENNRSKIYKVTTGFKSSTTSGQINKSTIDYFGTEDYVLGFTDEDLNHVYIWVKSSTPEKTTADIQADLAGVLAVRNLGGMGTINYQPAEYVQEYLNTKTIAGRNTLTCDYEGHTGMFMSYAFKAGASSLADYPVRGTIKVEDWETPDGYVEFLAFGKAGTTIPTETLRKW